MGFLDNEVMFSDGQAISGFTVTDNASTNIYDTGAGQSPQANGQGDAGQTGENLWINVIAKTALTSGSAASLVTAVLQDSADGTTFADVVASKAFTASSTGPAPIIAGTVLLQVQPPVGMRRYWRIAYRVGTAVFTGGTVDGYVSNTIQRNIARQSGIPAVG